LETLAGQQVTSISDNRALCRRKRFLCIIYMSVAIWGKKESEDREIINANAGAIHPLPVSVGT
jgi:hypothetical protein